MTLNQVEKKIEKLKLKKDKHQHKHGQFGPLMGSLCHDIEVLQRIASRIRKNEQELKLLKH